MPGTVGNDFSVMRGADMFSAKLLRNDRSHSDIFMLQIVILSRAFSSGPIDG